ncbi:MAG: T9SS type A sorting domain-containing protein, partial [Pedobacter sp.]
DVVPLQFKAGDAGLYTIAIEYIDGLFAEGQAVYLRDKLTGTEQNLQEGAYNFSTEAGTFNDRFEIVYAQALGTGGTDAKGGSAVVYKQGSSIVITTGTVQMTAVTVFDMQGRKIYSAGDINASEFSVNNLQSQQQVLIVQVTTPHGKFSRKIVF